MNEDLAKEFAQIAHIEQKRKYTGEPYFNHCLEVADILKEYCPHNDDMICAALLHDTIEDTNTNPEDIKTIFGENVLRMVMGLTDQATKEMGNRAVRKTFECNRIANEDWDVQTIKCCDLISNTISIAKHDPNFAVVYLKEKRNLLNAMTKADPIIRNIAFEVLERAEKMLKEKV